MNGDGRSSLAANLETDRTPMVSVVMPVWNADSNHVREAIGSIITQTLTDWELIIVEDPSPRLACETVRSVGDPRIRYFANEERTSLVRQRNRALDECRAPLVAMLDSDDLCEPQRLEEQRKYLEEHPDCDVLGCQLRVIDQHSAHVADRDYPLNHEDIARLMSIRNAIPQPGVMFRRDRIVSVGAYQYDRYMGLEDYELWSRLLKQGARFANHPKHLVRYRIHDQQIKHQRIREQILGTIDVKQRHWSKDLGPGARVRLLLERMIVYLPPRLVLYLFRAVHFRSPAKLG